MADGFTKNFSQVDFIRQIDSSDCASACLAMVCKVFGSDTSLSETRRVCGVNASGQQICDASESFGLKGSFYRKKFQSLSDQQDPFIAHWQGNHWVLVLEFKKGNVKIADPAAGIYWLSLEEAKESYSGYICSFTSVRKVVQKRSRENWLLPCLEPFKKIIIPAAFFMLFVISAKMTIIYFIQKWIDDESFMKSGGLSQIILYVFLTGVCLILGRFGQNILLSRAAQKSEALILDSFFKKWLTLPAEFFQSRNFSELRNRFESVFKIKNFLVDISGSGLFIILEFIAIIAFLEYYNKALVITLYFSPTLLVTFLIYKYSRLNSGKLQLCKDRYLSSMDDMTKGIFSIKASSSKDLFWKTESAIKKGFTTNYKKYEWSIFILESLSLFLSFTAVLLIVTNVSKSYYSEELTVGGSVAVLLLTLSAVLNLKTIIFSRQDFVEGAVVYDCLHDVFDIHTESDTTSSDNSLGSISWKNCSVKGLENSVSDFSLDVEAQEHCFINVSGEKLLNQLISNRAPISGSCVIKTGNGEYELGQQLPVISRIEEYPHLFSMSIFENVALSKDFDEEKVRWCLRLALADDLEKRLTYGLKTIYVDGAFTEAEERKVVLARTLYREASLYILQNLSDFLTKKEQLVFGYHLKCHLSDKTILISDRSPLISKSCTKIAIVKNGRLIESGSPENLLENGRCYKEILSDVNG
ncbi:MAG: cysteine peptidase family C39 domain-containing protein [Lentisphaeraceae bacterium]|nr:cysteine peptidase family C39 domain-containing protein [Lentisphaeraceae bacterium]